MSESVIILPDDVVGGPSEHDTLPASQFMDVARLCVQTMERIAELNCKAVHASLDEQRAIAMEAAGECSPFEAWRLQTCFALAGTAKVAAYWRHLNEITLGALVDAVGSAERRVNSTFVAMIRSMEETSSGTTSPLFTGEPAFAAENVRDAARIIRGDPTPAPPPSRPH